MALACPGAEEVGVGACVSFRVQGKDFLFLYSTPLGYELKLTLDQSVAEAWALSTKQPELYRVNPRRKVFVTLRHDDPLPEETLSRWIEESYRLQLGSGA